MPCPQPPLCSQDAQAVPATPEEAVAIEKKAMSEGIDRQMMPLYVTTWLEPVPAQFGRQQGFILDEGGSAESVNHGDAQVRELAGC